MCLQTYGIWKEARWEQGPAREAMVQNNIRAFGAPARYVQGAGVLEKLPDYCAHYGKTCFVIIDTFFYAALSRRYAPLFTQLNLSARFLEFAGEITREKLDAFAAQARETPPDLIVGIGGGKAQDAAKDVADSLGGLPVIVAPTIASCDAPTSSVAILYNDAGEQVEIKPLRANPALILVDTAVIAKAPPRYLAAGIGDAIATYFEGRANLEAGEYNLVGGWGFRPTLTGRLIAQGCWDIPRKYGPAAMEAARAGAVTEALEHVVEANILLSGVGFENMAVAGAHSIQAGLSAVPALQHPLHGEKVAFGILCQLVLENRDPAEFREVQDFLFEIGLPLTLADMGIANDDGTIAKIAENSFPSDWVHEPLFLTPSRVADAIKAADRMGIRYKKSRG